MSSQRLRQLLNRFRRRTVCVQTVTGIGWGLVAALLCLVVGVWLDLILQFPPSLRITTVVAGTVVAVGLLAGLVCRSLFRSLPDMLARQLDNAADTKGQIRAGVDLGRMQMSMSVLDRTGLTIGLAALAVERAARLIQGVSPSRVFPVRPIRTSFGVLGVIVVVLGCSTLVLPRVAHVQWLRFSDPFGDHPPYSRLVFHVHPAGAQVVYGDDLEIEVSVDGPPVDHVDLVLHARSDRSTGAVAAGPIDDVLPMFPEPGGRWRAAIANITTPMHYSVRSGKARSPGFRIDVITVPRIQDVRFRITAPDYTGLPVYTGKLPQGGLAGLPGTTVQLTVRSNRPLSGGELTFFDKDERHRMKLHAAPARNEATGQFTIKQAGRIDVRVVDVAGQVSTEAFSTSVTVLADERPFVRLIEPRAVSFATPTATVPAVIAGEDDYGISLGELYRSLNDSRYLPMPIATAKPPPKRLYQVVKLPLSAYALQPGDQIKLFARVVDNDPAALPDTEGTGSSGKGSESPVAILRIISQEDFEKMLRTRDGLNVLVSKYQQARRRVEALADQIEELERDLRDQPAGSALTEQTRRQLEQLAERMQEETDAIHKLNDHKLPYDLDSALARHLRELADSVAELAQTAASLSQEKDATNQRAAQTLSQMLQDLGQQRDQFDAQAMQPLELLAAIYPLSRDESRFVQIYQWQRDLVERLASLKGRDGLDDPALKVRMRELEEEQRTIRNELSRLLDDIEDHARRLPEDERLAPLRQTALAFAEAVRSSGAAEAMIDAETGLSAFSGTRGHAGAKKAADILESFLAKCQGMGMQGEAGACLPRFQPKLSGCIGSTVAQLLADAGLGAGPGSAVGLGAGNGFSARRSTLQNVGLYGGLPQLDALSGPEGEMSASGGRGDFRGRTETRQGRDAAAWDAFDPLSASGTGETDIPFRYRRQVGRYFQRIADELGSP